MRRYLAVLPLLLCACKSPEESHMKVIIGAVMIDGQGGPPVSNSVVVVAGGEIREAGVSSNIPVPAEADKIDGSGRFLVPGFVDVCPQAEPQGMVRSDSPEEARAQVAARVKAKAPVIYIGKSSTAATQAALEAAREAGIPAIGWAATEAGTNALVAMGASGIVGMIRDTETLDAALLARLRDLHIAVAPALSTMPPGGELEIARRNTLRLFAAGVPIAVASLGGDVLREAEALADAGIPPLEVIVAATRNGALALHQLERRGTIQPGRIADLILLAANPGEDVRNLRRVAGRLTAGEWIAK
ncbi:MAG: amidohydrolase family protein [Candidatus Sulfopaludibacter sp.]|nr:amidohydrolase family protein [Candidatus Sulfopaludibacter sp.]